MNAQGCSHVQGCVYDKNKSEKDLNPSFSLFELLLKKNKQTEWFMNKNIYFSQFWRLGIPRSWHWQIQYLTKAHFVIYSTLFLCLHMEEGGRELSQAFFYKGTNHFPKGPTSPSLWRLGFHYVNIWGTQTFRPWHHSSLANPRLSVFRK